MSTSNIICNCSIIVVLNITLLLCATSSENGLSMLFLQPDLQKCTVTGRGLQLAETGQPAHIEVHLVDTDAWGSLHHRTTGHCRVEVQFGWLHHPHQCSTQDPNTYEVSYQPNTRGRHVLNVAVNGEPV